MMQVYWCDIQPVLDQPEPFLRWCRQQGVRPEDYLCLDDAIRHLAGLQLRRFAAERDGAGLPANVSHSSGLVVCVCGNAAAGIDVEEILPSPALPEGFLTPEEQRWIQVQEEPHRAFSRLWTRKESLIKARRRVLADIPALPSLVEKGVLLDTVDGLHIRELSILPEQYTVSVSCGESGPMELIPLSIHQIFPI